MFTDCYTERDGVRSYKMLIGGEWIDAKGGETAGVYNPATEEIVGYVQKGNAEDADRALKAAKKAQPAWAALPARRRGEILYRYTELILEHREELAGTLTAEQGKLLSVAKGEVDVFCSFIRYACEGARRIEGDIIPSDLPDEQIWIQKVPYGVTVGITAWNFPLALAGRKIGPALIAGNVMVLKPTIETPISTLLALSLAKEAGIPDAVLSVVTGSGSVIGDALVRNPITKLVSMTGSSYAGQQIFRAAADNLTAVRLELGGKAPFIVFPDANIDKAAEDACNARFANCGQICTCNERMYIHEDIYHDFMERFLSHVKAIRVGDPSLPESTMGPKVNRTELENMERLVAISIDEGASIALGGKRLSDGAFAKGFWFEPTVLTDVRQDMTIVHEESFGPIVPVLKFRTFDEVIAMANDCDYGLAAYIHTFDMRKIMRLSAELEFGEIYINHNTGEQHQGFHNGYKMSGIGGEDGKYGFENYLEKKTFYVNFGDHSR